MTRPGFIPPQDWRGPPHLRPGVYLPRPHQVKPVEDKLLGLPPAPGPVVPMHELDLEHWPNGLRLLLGVTARRPTPQLAEGWTHRVTRSVGWQERAREGDIPRRWIAVESVVLRLRGPVVDGHGVRVVVGWVRPVVWLTHPRRHKPKPSPWTCDMRKLAPTNPHGAPVAFPTDITAEALKTLIRPVPTGTAAKEGVGRHSEQVKSHTVGRKRENRTEQ